MAILNYTTKISVDKTVQEIHTILVKHGAKSVRTDYVASQPSAVLFLIETEFGDQSFRLPANSDGVWRVMVRQFDKGQLRNLSRRQLTRQQAERVAWRITKDWIEAQMAIVEANIVTLDQVMLPYLQVDGDRTLYETIKEGRYMLPAAGAV
jgi:signal transduction protein with GAF and PtsI domain